MFLPPQILFPLPIDRLRNALAKQVSRGVGCLQHIPQRHYHRPSDPGARVSQLFQRTRQRPRQSPLRDALYHSDEPSPIHGVYPKLLINQFLPVLGHYSWC